MDLTSYEAGLWGFSWDEALGENGVQGSANLTEAGIRLDIPFGCLLEDVGVVKIGGKVRPTEAEFLYGYLRTGHYAVLMHAFSLGTTRSYPGAGRQTIAADYMLLGRGRFDPESKINAVKVELYGLRDWFGRLPFYATYDSDTVRYRSTVFDVGNIEKYKAVLLNNHEMKITVEHSSAISHLNVAGQSIKHDCSLRIDFAIEQSFDDVLGLVDRLSKFISFCTGSYAEVLNIELFVDGLTGPITCHAHFVKARNRRELLKEVRFSFEALENNIDEVLSHWLHPHEDLVEPMSILVSLETDDPSLTLDMKFLIAAQTLEAVSKVGIELDSMPGDEYKRYANIVIESVGDADVRKWIKERIPGNTKGQKRLLWEMFERNEEYISWLIGAKKAFLNKHIAARNRYTHRNGKEESLSGEGLYWHTEAVKLLCVCIISSLSGINSDTVISCLNRLDSKRYGIGKIKDMYSI